ncbi:MAG: hypothetical protein U0V70_08560 [Terriglobia bacterium]
MQPWFIATQKFTPGDGEAWEKYVTWSGLRHLNEVVSLDSMLCPTLLPEIKDEYWPYIVHEDFMLNFFTDLEFLLKQLPEGQDRNLLCVYRNPEGPPPSYQGPVNFELLGYDLVDVEGDVSALTNCGGFPDVFLNSELSSKGLLTAHSRAMQIRGELHGKHPEEPHADCHVWSISRAISL